MGRITVASFYVFFTAIVAVGLLLSSVVVVPNFFGYYEFPQFSTGAQVESLFFITLFGATKAIPAGLLFGVAFGFLILDRLINKAIWLSLCAAMLKVIYSGFILWEAGAIPGPFYWWVLVAEVIVFVCAFTLAAMLVNRLVPNMRALVRKITATVIVVGFFLVLYV